MGPCGVLIITTSTEIFWYKIVSFYSALVIVEFLIPLSEKWLSRGWGQGSGSQGLGSVAPQKNSAHHLDLGII